MLIFQDSSKPVLLIGATSRPDAVAAKLQSPGRLDRQLLVPLPDAHQRAFILQKLLSSQSHRLKQKDILDIGKQAYGFSGADLDVLIKSSWLNATERIEKVILECLMHVSIFMVKGKKRKCLHEVPGNSPLAHCRKNKKSK